MTSCDVTCYCYGAEFKDFVPQFTQRTVHNQGYETYDEVWKRASRWIHQTEPDAILNIQSVFVKFKKGWWVGGCEGV